ncbi:uncharacterized protein BJ171DRAFT_514403 [Polychytrium aggregatum]|uniref:uncharacterized protein n=1 Tax=Polychytrium aggregatum TaxID=110093 RepID=UPI0022FDDBF8|nr:uncharacterized protein BJ171DRAFT_514403 [Polychytrium aggregatum]KAI9202491.1 hypothetical protein BJ171DRAFT_514403 [Polychytrium aggregatum]
MTPLAIDSHNPDILAILCFNDSFLLSLGLDEIKTLLLVCRRAKPLLSFKANRFRTWCEEAELCRPDGWLVAGLTPSDMIALSLKCTVQDTADRSWLAAQSGQGNAAASYFLARILQVDLAAGTSVSDPAKDAAQQQIFQHLENAANTGHSMAQFHLAECCLSGTGVNQDHTRAVELYRHLADRGMPQAQVALGRCFENGEGIGQDYNTAIKWYAKAADQGSDSGRLRIVFLRAWFSFIGHGVQQSDVDALGQWHQVSTQSTDLAIKSIATHMVGWMHYLGRGTQRDEQKGVQIIRDSKSKEFPLGEKECLAHGGGSSNSPAARKFFELCQLGSHHEWLCKHLMAVCLVNGCGTQEDQKKAAAMFEKLAKQGHSDSQFWLGTCYWSGWGVSEDYKKAFPWYSKAANQGNSYGQWMVGFCYGWGYGVKSDNAKAIEWCRKSADQGNRYGQNQLDWSHQRGRGTAKDTGLAARYRKAAEQNFEWAISSFEELFI